MTPSTFLIQSSNNRSFGTGFVVRVDGKGTYLVTCSHVVEQCEAEFLEVDGKKAELIAQGSSDSIDLAVLYVEGLTDTKALTLCSESITENVLFEINGFKPHKRDSFKFEKLDGAIKKVSEIYANNETIKTYELSLEKEDVIEKGYSGSAVVLEGTDTVIAVATDRNKNGKDAYTIPIAYLQDIWKELPEFVNCQNEVKYKGVEKISFLQKMENQALNTIGGVIILAVITGFIYDALKPKDTTEETVRVEATKTNANLEEIKALIKQQGGNETEFLEKYFGEDYQKVLENPQTYHNLKRKLLTNTKTTQELLTERDELLKKINAQRLNSSIQKMIDKAFKELRYDDVRNLLDNFIKTNQDIGDDLIKAHFQKALSYIEEVKYHKAKEEFEKFIPVGVDDAEILYEYGSLYYILGSYDKMLEFSKKLLALNIKKFGENHTSVATGYNQMGIAWYSKGEYPKAIEFYNKSLKIRRSLLGENNANVAMSYSNLGSVWGKKGEYDKSIEFFNKALKIQLVTLGERHPLTATTYNNIGEALIKKGEYDRALEFHVKALKIDIDTVGENHPSTSTTYNNIGSVWFNKKEYDKAMKFYSQALKIQLSTLGENHLLTAISYNNIGQVLSEKGENDKAIDFFNKALKIDLNILGEQHSSTAITYNSIASVWYSKKRYDKAIEFYDRALKINIVTVGKNHPSTATIYNNIGEVFRAKGENDKAIEFLSIALKEECRSLGENHPSTMNSYNNIGLAWESKGEYEKAIEFYTKVLNIKLATLGEIHASTATTYNNIAVLYYHNHKYEKAYPYAKKVVEIEEVRLPKNHPNLINAKKGLALIEQKLNTSK